MKRIPFVFFAFVLISCQPEFNSLTPPNEAASYNNVATSLHSYYDRFLAEANKRNIQVDLSDVSGEIAPISDQGVAGTCEYGSHITNHITIDQDFWNNANGIYREFVVFHELGHCVLERGHREDADNQGRCLSIMRSGLSGCVDTYNVGSRDYFLDELFLNTD